MEKGKHGPFYFYISHLDFFLYIEIMTIFFPRK